MSPEISVDLVQPFIHATIETYDKMLGGNRPEAQKYTLNHGTGVGKDISATIGITGELLGTVSLSYNTDAALAALSAFIGMPITDLDDDSMDAVGELVNIIAGYAKQFIEDFAVDISLPTVIKGKGLVVKEPADVFSFCVPFKSAIGDFDLNVGLKKI